VPGRVQDLVAPGCTDEGVAGGAYECAAALHVSRRTGGQRSRAWSSVIQVEQVLLDGRLVITSATAIMERRRLRLQLTGKQCATCLGASSPSARPERSSTIGGRSIDALRTAL
jgi:hypothetical protein